MDVVWLILDKRPDMFIIAAEYLEKLVKWCENIKIPDPQDGCRLGPFISGGQYEKMMDFVSAAKKGGATVLYGGERPKDLQKGYFVLPTVITDVKQSMQIWREEVFGPVLLTRRPLH